MKKEKAKRWKVNEGVKALRDGDVKARMDIATRFPMFATATLEEIVAEVTLMTVRQVEIRLKKKLLKGHVEDTDVEDDDTDTEEDTLKGYYTVGHDGIKHPLPKPDKKEDTPEAEEVKTEVIEKKDNSTADEFYGEDDKKEDPPKERKVDKGTGEIYPPDEEKTTEPSKKDIPDDDFDELFSDMED